MEQTAADAGDLHERARAAMAQVNIYRLQGKAEEWYEAAQRAAQAAALIGATEELRQARMAQDEASRQLGNIT
ncbi:MAG: hypothetical protein R3C44_04265 [Chloroflexota bacterium]